MVGVSGADEPKTDNSPAADPWFVRTWRTEDGLPQNTINAILQTRDGFLWVGTNGGLARFDGVRFRKFGLQEGLHSVRISTLVEDGQGVLWVGTTGGGVARWENGRFVSFGKEEGFPTDSDIVSMLADRDGSVWIGTVDGLVRWSHGKFTLLEVAQGLPQTQVRALAQDSEGTLWVSMIEDCVFRRVSDQFVRLEKPGPVTGDIYSLFQDRDGSVWAGAGNGVLWHGEKGNWQRFDTSNGFPIASFMGMAQGGDGTLWIAAQGKGLYRLENGRSVSTLNDASLSGVNIRVVAVDRDGSIWVGTAANGLSRICPRVLRFWNGLGAATINSIAEDAAGKWWEGAGENGIHLREGNHFGKLEDVAVPLGTRQAYSMASAEDGSIWAAGEQFLYHFRPGQPTRSYLEAPIRGEAIRALCVDGDGVWAGTYYSTLLRCDEKGVRTVAPRGTFHGDITSIVREDADTLWIGTSGGLHRWRAGEVRRWGAQDGLLSGSVRALLRDPDGTLWIGTMGGGLARMKNGRFLNFTTRDGLIDDVISQIVADDFGCLWLGCNQGIMRIERRELDALAEGKVSELHFVAFGKNQGLQREQCTGGHSPTAIKTKDGRLLFPIAGGVAEMDPKRLQELAIAKPKACVDSVYLDGRLQPTSSLVIPPGHHRLEVHFTAPALLGGEWLRFRHHLRGLDNNWVQGTRERMVSYDGLNPGSYVFQVAVADAQGKWDDPGAKLAVTVQSFVWQTLWFQGGVMVLLIGAGSVAAWWQLHRRHLRAIEEMNRTQRQQEELARVSRASTLGQLTAALAHELNQPLAAILSNAQAARRFLRNGTADMDEISLILDDIVRDDKRAGGVIQNLRAMLGKAPVVRSVLSANQIVRDSADLVKGELAENGVLLRLSLMPDLPRVEAASVEVEQVLVNLLLNAIHTMQGMPPGRRIAEIVTEKEDGGVLVSVRDYGLGIPPDKLSSLFEPFFTTKSSGMGMGLTICRRIIESHGGRIEARNHEVGGAVFAFFLPGVENRKPD